MPTVSFNQFKGLQPAFDVKKVEGAFVVDGKNFLIDVNGPYSGFGKEIVAYREISKPRNMQSFKILAGTLVVWFNDEGIFEYNDAGKVLIPRLLFGAAPTESFPWTHATVGGKEYFARKGFGLYEFDTQLDTWTQIDSLINAAIPNEIQACTQSAGRLIITATGITAWSAIDDGRDFSPSIATGAGAQSLAIIAATGANDLLGVYETVGGFLVYTNNGILRGEAVQSANPFRFRQLSTRHVPLNAFCIGVIEEFTHLILTITGFYTTDGRAPEQFDPVMSEYFKRAQISQIDLTLDASIRFFYNDTRQILGVSLNTTPVTGQYNKAFVLYTPLGQWGSFDQLHTTMVDLQLTDTPAVPGVFDFGFVDPLGNVFKVTGNDRDLIIPSIVHSHFAYRDWREFPARSEFGVYKMPSRILTYPVKLPALLTSELYDLEMKFQSLESPDDIIFEFETDDNSGPVAFMRSDNAMSHVMTKTGIAVAARGEKVLDSFIELGLMRLTNEVSAADYGLITTVVIGMIGDESVTNSEEDWLNDFQIDLFEDWLILSGFVDWGALGLPGSKYQAEISGTDDGYRLAGSSLIPMTEIMSLVSDEGATHFYACENNARYHKIKITTPVVGDSFHLRTMELDGIFSGRL